MHKKNISKRVKPIQSTESKFQNHCSVIDVDALFPKYIMLKKKSAKARKFGRRAAKRLAKSKLHFGDLSSDKILAPNKNSTDGVEHAEITFQEKAQLAKSINRSPPRFYSNKYSPPSSEQTVAQQKTPTPSLTNTHQPLSPSCVVDPPSAFLPPDCPPINLSSNLSTVFGRLQKVWEISQSLENLRNRENALKLHINKLNSTLQENRRERNRLKAMRSTTLKVIHRSKAMPIDYLQPQPSLLSFPAVPTAILSVPESDVQICDGITGQGDIIRPTPLITQIGSLAPTLLVASSQRVEPVPEVDIVKPTTRPDNNKTKLLHNSFKPSNHYVHASNRFT